MKVREHKLVYKICSYKKKKIYKFAMTTRERVLFSSEQKIKSLESCEEHYMLEREKVLGFQNYK